MKKEYLLSTLGICLLTTTSAFSHSREVVIVREPVVVVPQPAPYVMVSEPAPLMLVQNQPPPEREEVMTPCPGPNYYWVKGCWKWNNSWQWNPGAWVVRPTPAAVWVPGTWTWHHHHHGWYWVEGRWQ